MTIKMTKSAYAIDWGTEGKVTENALRLAIGILSEYEMAMCGYDHINERAIPDDIEMEEANEIVSVIAMLKRDLAKRQRDKIARVVWRDAESKGWRRDSPAMRANVEAIIDRVAKGGLG